MELHGTCTFSCSQTSQVAVAGTNLIDGDGPTLCLAWCDRARDERDLAFWFVCALGRWGWGANDLDVNVTFPFRWQTTKINLVTLNLGQANMGQWG